MSRRLSNAEIKARVEREEVRLLLEDRKFRKFIWRLFGKSGMYASSHRSNPVDTSRAEGRRDLGNDVLTELRLAQPDALLVILGEYPHGLPGYPSGEVEPLAQADDDDRPEHLYDQ